MGECICFYTYGKECPDSENLSAHPEVQAYLEEHGLEGKGELLNFYLMLSVKEDGEGTGIVALPVRPRQK